MPASTSSVSDPGATPQALLRAVRSYLDLGMVLTPNRASTTKGAYLPHWTSRRLSLEELERELDRPGKGIGVVLGEASGHLVDVDIDHPAAVLAADLLMPPTNLVSGRTGRPRTHRFYRSRGAVTAAFKSEARGMLVELRASGCQTVLPPSPHPEGKYHWDSWGDPTPVDASVLRTLVGQVAAASLLIDRGWEPLRAVEFVRNPDHDRLSTWEDRDDVDAREVRTWSSVVLAPGQDDHSAALEPSVGSRKPSAYTQEVDHRAGGIVATAGLLGLDLREGRQRCPWHDGKGDRSLQVTGEVWRCHAGCGSGRAIHLAGKVLGLEYGEARDELARRLGLSRDVAGGTAHGVDPSGHGGGGEGGGGVNGSEAACEHGTSDRLSPTPGATAEGEDGERVPEPSAIEYGLAPSVEAGLILAACSILSSHRLLRPTTKDVLSATGTSRAQAYEMRNRIFEGARALRRPVGRPPKETAVTPSDEVGALAREVRDFLFGHPGAVTGGPLRRSYAASFRRFVVELRERYQDLDAEDFAAGVGVPARTISDWMRPGSNLCQSAPSQPPAAPATELPEDPVRHQRIQTILEAWERWQGGFVPFCKHVNEDLIIPYGRTLISTILEQSSARIPDRRRGRSPDERALRDQFETFFPGAQWSADGTPMSVEVAGECFGLNLELVTDPCSGAFVGASIREEEDTQAVVEAFEDATEETGGGPLALLLDNRPSNHTEEVDEALGDTLRQRSTPGRAQNKAHSEGGFGLLAQRMPSLTLESLRPADVARTILRLVVTTWARTLNHRPRRDRAGRSRAEIYAAASPTEKEVADARRALEERVRRQEQARATLLARQDPVVRQVLDDAFERLDLDDPEGHFRAAIGRYPLSHVVNGIAIYEGKLTVGTLPPEVDARYLLGIVRNVSHADEGLHVAEAQWRGRLEARDQVLLALDERLREASAEAEDTLALVCRFADEAITSVSFLERSFWLRALADAITASPQNRHELLFKVAARRIHATFRVPRDEREEAVRHLGTMVLPLT